MTSVSKYKLVILIPLAIAAGFVIVFISGSKLTTENTKTLPSSVSSQSPQITQQEMVANRPDLVKVTRVIDGDTIEIESGQRVRYIGIDTPETTDPSNPLECFSKEAAQRNKELVEGKEIRLVKDVSQTDKYGRLLRYVYEGDVFINDALVREGYAYASSYPPDIKYQSQFADAQKEAQEHNLGFWSSCSDSSSLQPSLQQTDSSCPIKGNISSSGEKIYHLPGQRYYGKTVIDEARGEKWFCTEEEAVNASWRKSKI